MISEKNKNELSEIPSLKLFTFTHYVEKEKNVLTFVDRQKLLYVLAETSNIHHTRFTQRSGTEFTEKWGKHRKINEIFIIDWLRKKDIELEVHLNCYKLTMYSMYSMVSKFIHSKPKEINNEISLRCNSRC